MREIRRVLEPGRLAAGALCLSQVDDLGQLVFEHEFGFADGLGGGAAASAPSGPFHRVHHGLAGGPETISCPSCHWVGGPNGAGAETDNAYLQGDGERTQSGDERNPPALLGLGVVQALALEMSEELQATQAELVRSATRANAAREVPLVTKGVEFGVLRASATGALDTSGVRGVDGDLVVKPFGWKGTLGTIADFAADALQVHIGIQSDFLLASGSPEALGAGAAPGNLDRAAMKAELAGGPFTALTAYLALIEMPVIEPLIQDRKLEPAAVGLLPPTTTDFSPDFQRGRRHFHALGCVGCHTPMLVLQKSILEIEGMPPIDLAREMRKPALQYDPDVGGYPVWLFSDLRRHDMGTSNRALHLQRGVALGEYLTPRLWGVADSAPYLHDGRAPSFDYAMAGHDGEGAAAREAFQQLDRKEKGELRVYLMSLRRAPRLMVP